MSIRNIGHFETCTFNKFNFLAKHDLQIKPIFIRSQMISQCRPELMYSYIQSKRPIDENERYERSRTCHFQGMKSKRH